MGQGKISIGDQVQIFLTTSRGKYYKKPRVHTGGVAERSTVYNGEVFWLVRYDTASALWHKGMPRTTVGWYPTEGLLPIKETV